MGSMSRGQTAAAEQDVVRIVQALQVLFGQEKVARYALVESMVEDRDSMLPLGLILGSLVRSHYRDLVMKTISGG